MKTILSYFTLSLLFALSLISCHNGKMPESIGGYKNDSMKATTDSAMTAHLVDPSNAFPRPAVTGPQEDSSRTYDSTSWFIANALQQSGDQIVLSDLAIKKASDKDIKKIADHIKTQHKALIIELRKNKTVVPTAIRKQEANSVSHHNIEILQKLSGNKFEKNWTDAMIEQHQQMIQQYESILTREPTKKIKTYIKDALPRLKAVLLELQSYSSIVYKT